MPPPRYMPPSYFGGMDRSNYLSFATLDSFGPVYDPNIAHVDGASTGLGPMELGTTLNPMQNQLQALQAKIREGASKIEFEFMGRGKGSSQASTPESYGKEEREIMRKLAHLNDIKSSTHATPNVSGLAGFGQRGFSRQQQKETIIEVQRAIDFAKDATTGGAIVVHTGEWARPVSPFYGQEDGGPKFRMYEGEDEDAPLYVVDGRTGDIIEGISKNRQLAVPKWHTAETLEEDTGMKIIGRPRKDVNGNVLPGTIQPGDFVDVDGNYIKEDDIEQLFHRVPKYNRDKTQFETEVLDWNAIDLERKRWNEKHPDQQLSTEEMYAKMQLENQILQAKGQSLYYLQRYETDVETLDALRKARDFYQQLSDDLPDDEKWKLTMEYNPLARTGFGDVIPTERKPKLQMIEEQIRSTKQSLRHIHEASSAADARAREVEERIGHLETMEEYGIKQTARALAALAEEAMEKSKEARKIREGTGERWTDLYIAPENWHPAQYGSHPKELLNIVREGRKEFKERLRHQIHDEAELDRLAKTHIKTTFDIGHLNMWRSMMEREPNESDEHFQKRFDDWVFSHLEKLHEEDAIGHLHLTDNFGYNDEHLSIGQGNAPVKKFVEWMKERGHTDFIIEPGSFNPLTIMPDAWSYLGAVNWKRGGGPAFRQMHNTQAGFYAPPTYIVGAYVPSNEWTLWSGVQLE